jgi:hypothetical protein
MTDFGPNEQTPHQPRRWTDSELSDAWEALVRGERADADEPAAFVRDVVDDLAAIDRVPPLSLTRRAQIWEDMMKSASVPHSSVTIRSGRLLSPNGRLSTVPLPVLPLPTRPSRLGAILATAALVLFTLLASFAAFRGSHPGRTDDDLMPIAALIDSLATPDALAPAGVTAVTLVETTLPAEALPRGVTGCALDLSDIPPESESTWNVFQNVNLRYVLSGEITVRSNSAAQVLRAGSDGVWEAVSAGTAVTLAPGDAVLFLNMTTATFSNSGLIPVETLGWQLVVGGSGGPNPTPPQWRGKNVVLCPAGGVALPGTPGLLRLRQVELAPDATLLPLPTAIIQMSLASPSNAAGTPVSVFGAGTKSDGTISNRDQKMAPFYVVTLELHAADNGTPQSGSPGA